MPQNFKNTSYYKKTDEQFLISPIPHNKKQTFLANLQGTKYPIYPVRTKEEEEFGIGARIKAKSKYRAVNELTVKWNSLCNGDTIFYKLPEHCKSGLLVIPAEALLLPFEWSLI
ncbi:hypothetical protein V1521DRAFT_438403 [Lipomyces starkeyi]